MPDRKDLPDEPRGPGEEMENQVDATLIDEARPVETRAESGGFDLSAFDERDLIEGGGDPYATGMGLGSRDVTDFGDYVRSDSGVNSDSEVPVESAEGSDSESNVPSHSEPRSHWIGPYLIRSKLGQGGMGAVYRAEQFEPIQREVAIKVILAPLVGQHTRHRFEAERQALARMNHPSIAQVFEAGDTPEGQPYFAMELVHGLPIDRYCDDHGLTIEERLELLIAACHGVQHAHQKGILHRDLKPDNILICEIEGVPTPKIIDFGVAKALDEGAVDLTAFGAVIGTPAYISPEALSRETEVDTRSDVYSLGVVLFQLLTGSRPFGRKGDSVLAIFQQITEEEAPAPSLQWSRSKQKAREKRAADRGTNPASHGWQLRGDLDWITLKAMASERDLRYSSAAELAADLERHLRHEPVIAARPGSLYRVGKFVRRRRGSVVAVGLLLLSLLAGIVARTSEARRANQAAEEARLSAVESQEVVDFLVELFREADPNRSQGTPLTVREMLDRGAAEIQGRLREQPLPRARLLATMGRVYEQLGLITEARALLEEGLALRRSVLEESSPEVAASIQQIGHLNWLAGDYPEAEVMLLSALAAREKAKSPDLAAIASALDDLGSVYGALAKFDQAEPVLRRALAIREELFGSASLEVAASLDDLAVFFLDQEAPEQALDYAVRALEIRRVELATDHPSIAVSANTTAINYFLLGRWDEGIALAEEALAIRRRVLPEDHPDLGQSLNNLGEALMLAGRLGEAEGPMREALAIWEKALGPNHRRVGVAVQNVAQLDYERGDLELADLGFGRAAAIFETSLGKEHPTLAQALERWGRVLLERGDPVRSESALQRSLEIRRLTLPPESPVIQGLESLLVDVRSPSVAE